MPLNSRLSKLIQTTEALHAVPDDEGDPGSKVHCIATEDLPWAILKRCPWQSETSCDGCIRTRPTDLEEVIDTCRTSSGDVK